MPAAGPLISSRAALSFSFCGGRLEPVQSPIIQSGTTLTDPLSLPTRTTAGHARAELRPRKIRKQRFKPEAHAVAIVFAGYALHVITGSIL